MSSVLESPLAEEAGAASLPYWLSCVTGRTGKSGEWCKGFRPVGPGTIWLEEPELSPSPLFGVLGCEIGVSVLVHKDRRLFIGIV